MPGRAAEIEAESRSWILTCSSCGHQRSYWEIGGVRFKAASAGKKVRVGCPACGRKGMHAVEWRPSER